MVTASHISIRDYGGLDFLDDFEVRVAAQDELVQRIVGAPIDTLGTLAAWTPQADPYQSAVIRARDRTIRVVAPAGSGKTQTVVNRALGRVAEGVHPSRILVLTFDNSAATSLKGTLAAASDQVRTETRQPPPDLGGLTIATLNSFGYGVLREFFREEFKPVIQRPRARRLVREGKEALRAKSPERHAALPSHLEHNFYLEFFSLLKNQLFDPRAPDAQRVADFMLRAVQATPFFPEPTDADLVRRAIQSVLWLFMAHERAMQRDGALDFDDQKLRAFVSLSTQAAALRAVQGRYTEVVVDEFQDINLLDFEFIKTVAERADLVVTGDDDQAIYGFRGCTPEFVIDLERRLGRPVASHELQTNYRCPPNIVRHADRLIRHNTRRIPKNPVAAKPDPSDIKVVSTLSAGLEARSTVAFVGRVLGANRGLKHSDVAVLYRTNAQSLPLQIEFVLNDVPYFVRDEDNILGNEALERLLGVLRLKLAHATGLPPAPQDQVLAVRAYFRYLDGHEVDGLRALLDGRRSFRDALVSPEFHAVLPKARNSQVSAAVAEALGARTLLDALDVLAKRFKGLSGMVGSLEDVIDQKAPLAEIREVAANFRGDTANFVATVERALARARATNAGKDAGGVALLTYFKSKGRQWHTVVLTTCNEGLIPHRRAPIEDERRLFYVALTRATSNLLVSYVADACNTKVAPSRFLTDAGLLP